jgi:pilus assembly protein Flp/PilA
MTGRLSNSALSLLGTGIARPVKRGWLLAGEALICVGPRCRGQNGAARRDWINGSLSPSLHGPLTLPTLDCAGDRAARTEGHGVFEMRKLISRFLADQSGATAIEYCLLATGISIVILVAVNGIGTTLSGSFTSVNSSLK